MRWGGATGAGRLRAVARDRRGRCGPAVTYRAPLATDRERSSSQPGKDTIVRRVLGTGEILDTTGNTVSGSIVNAIRGTGAVGVALTSAVSDVVRGAILGTAQIGGDVGGAARNAVEGAIAGARDLGLSAEKAAAAAATVALQGAGDIGGTAVEHRSAMRPRLRILGRVPFLRRGKHGRITPDGPAKFDDGRCGRQRGR